MEKIIAIGFILAVLSAVPAFAQHHHPAYQHAMANLDAANKLLETISKPSATSDLQDASKEINSAYEELRNASRDDQKNLDKQFAPATEQGGPLHKVRELVESAHHDMTEPEDDAAAQPIQQKALAHLDAALKHLDAAIAAPGTATVGESHSGSSNSGSNFVPHPGEHPAYLHALVYLRSARAHIEHDKRGGLGTEEQEAIKEIDSTIGRIHHASLDDGKDLNDHPPIDPKLDRKGLLHKALALLEQTKTDISEHESDNFANGLRQEALGFLEEAQHHLKAALNVTEGK
jgi:hypothetical protein